VITIVGLLTAGLVAGCQHAEDRYLKRPVTADEVVGVWQMTDGAVKDLRDVGYTASIDPAEHQMVLRGDGTCDFRTLPRVLTEAGTPAPRMDAPCRWKLGNMGHQTLMIEIESNPLQRVYYYFSEGSNAQLEVWQHAGDPDAWRYVEYVKQ
jgi:hypothetical protein